MDSYTRARSLSHRFYLSNFCAQAVAYTILVFILYCYFKLYFPIYVAYKQAFPICFERAPLHLRRFFLSLPHPAHTSFTLSLPPSTSLQSSCVFLGNILISVIYSQEATVPTVNFFRLSRSYDRVKQLNVWIFTYLTFSCYYRN